MSEIREEKTIGDAPVTPHLTYSEISGNANGFKEGLTKREYFAAMAMQGLCASGFFTERKLQDQAEQAGTTISVCLSVSAVDIADALINELNK